MEDEKTQSHRDAEEKEKKNLHDILSNLTYVA